MKKLIFLLLIPNLVYASEPVDSVVSIVTKGVDKIIQQIADDQSSLSEIISKQYQNCLESNKQDRALCDYKVFGTNKGVYTGYGDQELNKFTSIYIEHFRHLCSIKGSKLESCETKWKRWAYIYNFDMALIIKYRPGVEWSTL